MQVGSPFQPVGAVKFQGPNTPGNIAKAALTAHLKQKKLTDATISLYNNTAFIAPFQSPIRSAPEHLVVTIAPNRYAKLEAAVDKIAPKDATGKRYLNKIQVFLIAQQSLQTH